MVYQCHAPLPIILLHPVPPYHLHVLYVPQGQHPRGDPMHARRALLVPIAQVQGVPQFLVQ